MKKILAIALALLMLLGTVAVAEEAPATPLLNELIEAAKNLEPSKELWFENGLTITALGAHFNNNPQGFDGCYYWPAIESLTNAHIDIDWRSEDGIAQAVEAALAEAANGGKLPDIMNGGGYSARDLYEQGAIIALDDYLDLIPNVVEAVGEDRMAKWRSADGHIYSIPTIVNVPGSQSLMVRKDWLDQLDMEIPTTWDEWVAVWRAFKENDLNGNGDTTDEIPLAFTQGGNGESSLIPLLNCFGIAVSNDGQFCVLEDGTYTMVYEHPRYREFLEAVRELYAEGLLDQEFSTRYQAELYTVMDAGLVGTAFTWAERARVSTETLVAAGDEDALWQCVAPIQGPHGDQMTQEREAVSSKWLITTQAEKDGKVEDILRLFNWNFGKEGNDLYNYGIEGVSYDVVDGVCVMKPELLQNGFTDYRGAGMQYEPFGGVWQTSAFTQCLFAGGTPETLTGGALSFYEGLAIVNNPYFYSMPQTLGTDAYMEYHSELITTGVVVARDQCVAGQISVDDFFAQYEDLKARGLDQVIEECSAAYAEIMGTK